MRRAAVIIAVGLALSSPARAVYTVSDVLMNLEGTEKAMTAVKFNFVQTVDFTGTGQEAIVKGVALFGKGGRLRITKAEPEEQITISNGTKIWIYTPSFKQVWEGSAKKWMESPAIPKGLVPLDGYVADLRQNFNLQLLDAPEEDTVRLKAVPKQADAGYSLVLTISTRSWLPMKTKFASDTAAIETVLSDVELNPTLAKNVFQFTSPKGVDVIPLN